MELPGQINPLEWFSLASHIPASSSLEGSSLSCHFFSSLSEDFQGLMGPKPDIDNLPDEFGEFFSLQSSSSVKVHFFCELCMDLLSSTLPFDLVPRLLELRKKTDAYWVLKPHWKCNMLWKLLLARTSLRELNTLLEVRLRHPKGIP